VLQRQPGDRPPSSGSSIRTISAAVQAMSAILARESILSRR
jgi:hypothetical protein